MIMIVIMRASLYVYLSINLSVRTLAEAVYVYIDRICQDVISKASKYRANK